jgi:predicted nucleic acid-binding protein
MRPRSAYIFVDSSAWYALVNARDKNHLAAKRFLEASHRLLTTNFVIDETITLVLVRKGYQAAVDLGEQLWSEEQARIVWLSRADQRAAWQLFKRYSDKEFSFTDCTSFVVMERLGLAHAFAFYEHFSQTGQFVCVPHRR